MLLSEETHHLAARYMSGEVGRTMRDASFSLPEQQVAGVSEPMRYALAVRAIAEKAPLRHFPGEKLVGAATLLEATFHKCPVAGTTSISHTTIGFGEGLAIGYVGLRQRIDARTMRGDLDDERVDYLRAMRICLDAAGIWQRRNLGLLERRVRDASGQTRAEYQRVLESARHVPEEPPRSFREAIQSLWLMFEFQRLCGNWSGIGRIDQMLGPYLERDLSDGVISLDEARELLAHFWIKGTEWTGAREINSGDAQYYQNIILSGVDEDGNDVTNAVTYLVLDVVDELLISDFPIAVRISSQTPERLLRRVANVQRRGGGIVAVYNEEKVIQALTRFGYSLREARSFANDGCWEVLIPGHTAFSYDTWDLFADLQDLLGVTRAGEPAPDYGSFDDLYAAFYGRLAATVDAAMDRADEFAVASSYKGQKRLSPLLSMLVHDCIEHARDYMDRGARFTVRAPHPGGVPDVANALRVIRALVYERAEMSLPEFVSILRSDWRDHERLRLWIRNRVSLYGNDDPAADAMVRRVFDDYVALVEEVPKRNGVLRPAGMSTFGRQIEWAPRRGASPAGNHAGDYLANNFSPAPGTDRAGPTAVIKSFCAVDFRSLPNGTALELKIHPTSVQGEAGVQTLTNLYRTFVELGGWFMHIDIVDGEMLRDAQAHPEKYPTLAVRVSGWSARFATLDRPWQDMIIRRTEQQIA